jgi:hypothetical protein
MKPRFWNTHRHWHSGEPLDASLADFRITRIVFGLWIAAFILKHIGASWDVAWHFRFLRDDLIPPHIVNLSGNFLALGLLWYQYLTRTAVERTGFMILLAGFALFIAAMPLDLLNHRFYGLDVTIWSIPHLMFFFGSTLALIGLLRSWLRLAPIGRWRTAYTLIFLTLLMDCAIFVLGQHEYGVLSVAAFRSGRPTASDDLLALAHGNVAGFATGWMPAWVYPIWMVLAGTLVLTNARRVQPGRWTAIIVAALYLAYRGAGYSLLVAAKFPPSFIPVMVLIAAVALDMAAQWRWRPVWTTAGLLLAWYGSAAVVGQITLMPTFAPETLWIVAIPLWGVSTNRGSRKQL